MIIGIKDIEYIIEAHSFHTTSSEKKSRKWDANTPYSIHPIWCAMSILHETSLPISIRSKGFYVLGYHDIPEDTDAPLPEWLSSEIKKSIADMTYSSSEDEWENLWKKDKEIRLFKIYDKTSNIMDGIWMEPERKNLHLQHLAKLIIDVRKNYGELNITRMAKSLI